MSKDLNCTSYAFAKLGIDPKETGYRVPPTLKRAAQLFRRIKPGETPDAFLIIGNRWARRDAVHMAVVEKDDSSYVTHRPGIRREVERVHHSKVRPDGGYSTSVNLKNGFLPEHKIAVKLRKK